MSETFFLPLAFNSFLIKILVICERRGEELVVTMRPFNSFLIKILVIMESESAKVSLSVLFQFFFNQDFGHLFKGSSETLNTLLTFNSFLIKILVIITVIT